MANTSSAKKAARASLRRRVYNERRKRAMKTGVKEFRKIATSKSADATAKLPEVFQAIDKALKRGVIKKNTAARMKSKLSKMLATK
ncbi:MAG: 30S ribosomal protein S20 [Candidatus Pacebacteria bacterium]|nr:30S ribosomal protein S20 [Candidatus Paceibacterota bacterium]